VLSSPTVAAYMHQVAVHQVAVHQVAVRQAHPALPDRV
jgi:hypothetical protein